MSVTALDTRDTKVKYQGSYLLLTVKLILGGAIDLYVQYNVMSGVYDDIHIPDAW